MGVHLSRVQSEGHIIIIHVHPLQTDASMGAQQVWGV